METVELARGSMRMLDFRVSEMVVVPWGMAAEVIPVLGSGVWAWLG